MKIPERRMSKDEFFLNCRGSDLDIPQCELLLANRGRRTSIATLWSRLQSSWSRNANWPKAKVNWEDGGPNFWLSPKGAVWHCSYGWHSRIADVLSGKEAEGSDWLMNRGWIHVSGGRADYHCPLTTTQKRILEREYPTVRMNPSYDYSYWKDASAIENGKQVVVRWDSPFDYRTLREPVAKEALAHAA